MPPLRSCFKRSSQSSHKKFSSFSHFTLDFSPSLDLLFVPARESGDKRRAFRWEPEKRGTFERAEGSARPGQGEAGIQVDGVEPARRFSG